MNTSIATAAFDNINEMMAREEVPLSNMQRSLLMAQLNIWVEAAYGDGVRSAMGNGRTARCICAHMMSPNGRGNTGAWTCPRHGMMVVD